MKFTVTMKDPDGVYDSVTDAIAQDVAGIDGLNDCEREEVAQSRREALEELMSRWFEFDEYLRVEIDTEGPSIRVLPRNGA